ncbi:nucleotidyl transferase AbiEii/AbiGii toxin family protein [Pseudomonas putida]|uniref:Nucleotidyl transferase AbiEii/AbiGii toxin family protein n=1 Tax=Pseudomonas putida TaxID=303 RepID=A0A8I1EEF9_PSEPU|nr:nucleotidyl transferase AbiEii/AbiGii toxin family protein [Pseudomonas putida]MBI6885119.1 nucleotidyl transferase AbiEii/AbiGii toxin family protein [Pseudomonas putida]
MREISLDKNYLTDFILSIEQDGILISEAAVEKDFHVTDALVALSGINNDHFELVFCGGTCLSKGYQIIQRFSEDIDLKVVRRPGVPEISKSATRRELGALKDQATQALISAGFTEAVPMPANNNSYIGYVLPYASIGAEASTIRSAVKVELVNTSLLIAPEPRRLSYLHDSLIGKNKHETSMKCVSPSETLIEKLVSFPRRLSRHLTNNHEFDQNLVRHLYDVHQIARNHPQYLSDTQKLKSVLMDVIKKDLDKYKNSDHLFASNSIKTIRDALEYTASSKVISDNYRSFVKDMVYQKPSEVPSFEESVNIFSKVFNDLSIQNHYGNGELMKKLKSSGIEANTDISSILDLDKKISKVNDGELDMK